MDYQSFILLIWSNKCFQLKGSHLPVYRQSKSEISSTLVIVLLCFEEMFVVCIGWFDVVYTFETQPMHNVCVFLMRK